MSRSRALVTVVTVAFVFLCADPSRSGAAQWPGARAPQESESVEPGLLERLWGWTPATLRERICRVTKADLCGPLPGPQNDPGDAGCVIDPSGHCIRH